MGLVSRQIESLQRKIVVLTGREHFIDVTLRGEMWGTVVERERDVWTQHSKLYDADEYVILISKDNLLFPHKLQAQIGTRINITSFHFAADLSAAAASFIRLGVISRIDGNDADIQYFKELPFMAGPTKNIITGSVISTPSQIKLDFDGGGILQHGITNRDEMVTAAVKTSVTLDSPAAEITPGLGDVILRYDHITGSITFSITLLYHLGLAT